MLEINCGDSTLDEVIGCLTPIELPTDEEIEQSFNTNDEKYYIFTEGAKWVKEQILNQTK